jgi:hypothetical protein
MATQDRDDDFDQWGREYVSQFGKAGAGFYPPKVETINRDPDRRPSSSRVEWSDDPKKDIRIAYEVRGEYGGVLGVIVMRASSGHAGGVLRCEELASFTTAEMLFEPKGYLTHPEIQVGRS